MQRLKEGTLSLSNIGKYKELAAHIIDYVEDQIRREWDFIDDFARESSGGTLLEGDAYYKLEDMIAEEIKKGTADITPESIKDWSDEDLQSNYMNIWENIERIEYYNDRDLTLKEMIVEELERRGFEIIEEANVTFIKDG